MATSLEENSGFKPVKIYLKIDLVLHSTHADGLVYNQNVTLYIIIGCLLTSTLRCTCIYFI